MTNVKDSSFSFVSFHVMKSVMNFSHYNMQDKLDIDIEPTGIFDEESFTYLLTLKTKVRVASLDLDLIEVISESKFHFSESFDEVPGYFTLNAPAITFPYLRSYISALSSLSGLQNIMLPILNLVEVGNKLKENFVRKSKAED